MGHEAIKLELNEWLKTVKDAKEMEEDWWLHLTDEQKSEIEKGLKDVDEGRIVSHEIVKRKYSL